MGAKRKGANDLIPFAPVEDEDETFKHLTHPNSWIRWRRKKLVVFIHAEKVN